MNNIPHPIRAGMVKVWRSRPYKTVEVALNDVYSRQLRPYKFLYKLLEKAKTRRGGEFVPPLGLPAFNIQTAVDSVATNRTPKRIDVLNKLFMRSISEVLSTGEVGLPLLGHNIHINDVKVNHAYTMVTVYWLPQGTDKDDKIQRLLNDVARPLRSELIKLRAVGLVPEIRFVKDKYAAYVAEVDRLLKIADYGEGYVPQIVTPNSLSSRLQLKTQLSDFVKEKIFKFENNDKEEDLEEEFDHLSDLSPLHMSVFGLNYNAIYTSIKESVRKTPQLPTESTEPFDKDKIFLPYKIVGEPWDKENFRKFLKDRRKLMIRTMKLSGRRRYEDVTSSFKFVELKTEEDNDELYNEFVKNAFPDFMDDFDTTQNYEKMECSQ